MSESRAAGWSSDSPTAAQLKEFFSQIESGKISKKRLQSFLRQPTADPAQIMRNFPIEVIEFRIRTYNCLKRVGVETIGDLLDKSEDDLRQIPNFVFRGNDEGLVEVREKLAKQGLALKGEQPPGSSESDSEPIDEKATLIDLFNLIGLVNRRLDLPNEIAEVHRLIDRDEEHIQILPAERAAQASDHKSKLESKLAELKKEQDELPAKIAECRQSLALGLDIEL